MKDTERRVLTEIKGLGVPIQILINKADRLTPNELTHVKEHVVAGLAETGIGSYTPPIAFSARLSLRGRLGDADALSASGFAAVESLFSEHIVDRSSALRETALRRKALRIATDLASIAASRAAEDRERIRAERTQREALATAAAKLLNERHLHAAAIEKTLDPVRKILVADLRPLKRLGEGQQAIDPSLHAYVEERFVARLTDPICQEIAKLVGVRAPASATAAVKAVLLGAVSALDPTLALQDQPLVRIVDAAIAAFAAALVAEAAEALPSAPFAALEQRAALLRDALVIRA